MRIFLSHAHEQKRIADRLALGLRQEGHDVFLDKDDLAAGDGYEREIRNQLQKAGLFIFLISPESTDKGYAMTEVELARKRWRNPSGRVLPVMVVETPFDQIPEYLSAVTLLRPAGDLKAEVLAAVVVSVGVFLAYRATTGAASRSAVDPVKETPIEAELCMLQVELKSGRNALPPGGFVAYVSHADGSERSVVLSESGGGSIEASRNGSWSVVVDAADGVTLGRVSVDHCPEVPEELILVAPGLELNEPFRLAVTPR
jgi:hypothetical protein